MSKMDTIALKVSLIILLILTMSAHHVPLYAQVAGDDIVGLQGTLTTASDKGFGHYFDTSIGQYGLVGETPEIERELTDAAKMQPASIKIWGTKDSSSSGDPQIIIVSSILVPRPPTVTPYPTPADIVVIVIGANATLRTGPGSDYPIIRQLDKGEACDVLGKSGPNQVWLLVQCVKDSANGWLRRGQTRVVGDTSAVPVMPIPPTPLPTPSKTATARPQPTATSRPTATPQPPNPQLNHWRAEYMNTGNLSGNAAVDRIETRDGTYPLDRRWYGTPVPGVRREQWSARWTGPFYFDAGDYLFKANFEGGGVRVYIDGIPILDYWNRNTDTVSNVFLGIGAGNHTIQIEHPNRENRGRLRVWWQKYDRARDE